MAQTPTRMADCFMIASQPAKSKYHPGYWYVWLDNKDNPDENIKRTVSFRQDQITWIQEQHQSDSPINEGEHIIWRDVAWLKRNNSASRRDKYDRGGSFLLDSIGLSDDPEPQVHSRRQEPILDDLCLDNDPPITWNTERDPKFVTAMKYAKEIAFIAETVIKEYPRLNSEDARAIAITVFINTH